MTNYPNRDVSDREVHQKYEVHQNDASHSPNQVVHTTEITQRETSPSHNAAYRDAYNRGRLSEQQIYERRQLQRDNDSAARGLLIGIIFTGLAAMLVGAFFLLNQRGQTPVLIQRIIPQPSPSASPSPQIRERIIEREQVVPVPQTPPQVNITVPNSSQQTAPSPAPAQQSVPTNNSGTQSSSDSQLPASNSANTGAGQ